MEKLVSSPGPGLEHFPAQSAIDHPSQAQPGIHTYPDKLYVCTVLENPLRWRSRYRNFWIYDNMCRKAGVESYVAEIAFGGRAFEITEPDNPKHLQLRTRDELLHKENALNLLIQRLPADAEYIGILDADMQFVRQDWAQEAMHLLQHYKVLQGFSDYLDLGPNSEPLQVHSGGSFVCRELQNPPHNPLVGQHDTKCPRHPKNNHEHHKHHGPCPCPPCPKWCCHGKPHHYVPCDPYIYPFGKKFGARLPGLAWFWRKSALNEVGGLLDWAMGGSADLYMALALFNRLDTLNLSLFTENFQRMAMEWQERAERYIRRNVGFMPGTALHYWHGHKERRQYVSRDSLMRRLGFDPLKHIKRDWQGLWCLHDDGSINSIQIRDGLRHLARLRDEDSMEVR
jgi:hypothetical protein